MIAAFRRHLQSAEWPWYAAAVAAVVLPWFARPGYLFLTDLVWGPRMDLDWRSGFFLPVLASRILGLMLTQDLFQKLFVAAALAAVILGGRSIVRHVLDDRRLVFAVSLFFLFSPFVYDRMGYGQIGVVAAFGLTCLALGDILSWTRRGIGRAVRAGVWAGLAVQLSPHFIFMFGTVAGAILVDQLLAAGEMRRQILKRFAAVAAILVLININLIASASGLTGTSEQYFGSDIKRQDLVAFQVSGENGAAALRNVLMLTGFWGKDQLRYQDLTRAVSGWGRSLLILMPLILWGVIAGWRDKKLRRLSVGLVVAMSAAVVLAVGIRLPLAREVTYWLFDHLPLYKGLRETQKWVAVIAIAYGFFLAIGVRELFKLRLVRENRTVCALFLGGVMVMQASLLLFGLSGQVRPVEYPSDWSQAEQAIGGDGACRGQVLFLPWHMYMSFGWIGNIVANPAGAFFSCPVIRGSNMEWGGIYDNSGFAGSVPIRTWLERRGETDLLDDTVLNISHVVLAKEVDWENYSWLDGLAGLKLVQDSENLRVYELTAIKR